MRVLVISSSLRCDLGKTGLLLSPLLNGIRSGRTGRASPSEQPQYQSLCLRARLLAQGPGTCWQDDDLSAPQLVENGEMSV